MRRFVFCAIALLSLGGQTFFSMINRVNVYSILDFENKAFYTRKQKWAQPIKRIISEALQEQGFSYNPGRDTVLVSLSFTDYIVFKNRIAGYYCPPDYIIACSSQNDLHLSLDVLNRKYTAVIDNSTNNIQSQNAIYNEKGTLLEIIKRNDINLFLDVYNKYHDNALGSMPDHVYRFEIINNRLVSCSEWVFELNEMAYIYDILQSLTNEPGEK